MKKYGRRRGTKRRGRRSRNAPLVRGIVYNKQKLVSIIEVKAVNTVLNVHNLVVSRFDFGGIIANVYGVNNPPRYAAVKQNWEQFCITGVAIKWMPTSAEGASSVTG